MLDALGGFCRLERRDGTLDGSVPLRVAQGCVPLLEGNAFGWQVVLTREVVLTPRLGGLRAQVAVEHRDALTAAVRGALPRLRVQGFVSEAWARELEAGVVRAEGGLRGRRVRLWTGLLVRPREGRWLRLGGGANRRNVRIDVDEVYLDDPAFTPLMLDLTVQGDGELRLAGEVATLAPFAPRAAFSTCSLVQAPALGDAHGAFYDASYFATKKGEITRKYRKLIARQPTTADPTAARCQVVEAGPAAHAVAPVGPFVGAAQPGSRPRPLGAGELHAVTFANLIPFRATFDGHRLTIDPDRDALARGARAVEERFAEALGPGFQAEHRGALWYLTKYFTPHPPGEAHFFVKPWAFVQTPPGWSCVLEGIHGPGYDVLRGVVSTDRFHATPAVFWLHQPGRTIEVPAGAPLLRVTPIPRELLDAGFASVEFLDAR